MIGGGGPGAIFFDPLLPAGVVPVTLAALALWRRWIDARAAEPSQRQRVQEHLDSEHQLFLDRLLAENARLRQDYFRAEERAQLNEMRARRADRYAHDFRHQLVNELQRQGAYRSVPHVPFLEDHFEALPEEKEQQLNLEGPKP